VDTLVLPAPAKLNLFLHVTGRRADGYHLLETLFHFLDCADRVTLTRSRSPGVRRGRGASGVAEDEDLALRAARLLARHCGARGGVVVDVDKRLPLGGGLGGGSSDAAAVLLGLDCLWGLDLGPERLAELGLELGADVPVFVHGRAALARGVGERLEPVRLAPSWYLVACPPVQVSTAAVFGDPSLTRNTPALTIGGFPWETDTEVGLARLLARTRNDCEPVVRAREPAVAAALDWLAGCAPAARMTGTGACVFARFAHRAAAERVLARAPRGMPAFVARGMDRSPLLSALAAAGRPGGGQQECEQR